MRKPGKAGPSTAAEDVFCLSAAEIAAIDAVQASLLEAAIRKQIGVERARLLKATLQAKKVFTPTIKIVAKDFTAVSMPVTPTLRWARSPGFTPQELSPFIRLENLREGKVYRALYHRITNLALQRIPGCTSRACALVMLHFLIDPRTEGYPATRAERAKSLGISSDHNSSMFSRACFAVRHGIGDNPEWQAVLAPPQRKPPKRKLPKWMIGA